jgi:hypothetical protein
LPAFINALTVVQEDEVVENVVVGYWLVEIVQKPALIHCCAFKLKQQIIKTKTGSIFFFILLSIY